MICLEYGEVLPPGPLTVRQCCDDRIPSREHFATGDQQAAAAPHHVPVGTSDRFAHGFTKSLRWVADTFFARRYGHRAIVLETVAGVPGMVGATLQHLRSLRRMEPDKRVIEQAVIRYVPEVRRVIAVDPPATLSADPATRFRAWVATKFSSA